MRNQVRYILSFVIVLFIKLLANQGDVTYLLWLLQPTAWLLEVFLNEPLQYVAGKGFIALHQPFVISKECAGTNFFIISFLSAVIGFLRFGRGTWQMLGMIGIFALLAYCLTILVNVFRIINILKFENALHQSSGLSSKVIHEAQGIFIYLSFLLLFYFCLHLFFKKYYEKLT